MGRRIASRIMYVYRLGHVPWHLGIGPQQLAGRLDRMLDFASRRRGACLCRVLSAEPCESPTVPVVSEPDRAERPRFALGRNHGRNVSACECKSLSGRW